MAESTSLEVSDSATESALARLVGEPEELSFPLDVDSYAIAIVLRNGVPMTAFPGGRHRRGLSPGVPMRGRREKVVIKTTEFPLKSGMGQFTLADGTVVDTSVELRLRFTRNDAVLLEAVRQFSIDALVKSAAQILNADIRTYLRRRLSSLSHSQLDLIGDRTTLLDRSMILMGGLFEVIKIDDVLIVGDETHRQIRRLPTEQKLERAKAIGAVELESEMGLIAAQASNDQASLLGVSPMAIHNPELFAEVARSKDELEKARIEADAAKLGHIVEGGRSIQGNPDLLRMAAHFVAPTVGIGAGDQAGAASPGSDGGIPPLRRDARILGAIADATDPDVAEDVEGAAMDGDGIAAIVVGCRAGWLRGQEQAIAVAMREMHGATPSSWLFVESGDSLDALLEGYYEALALALGVRPPRRSENFSAFCSNSVLHVNRGTLDRALFLGGPSGRARRDLAAVFDVREVRLLEG